MTRLKLKHIHRFQDRHGHIRHYFRRSGHPRVALPGQPGSSEFMAAYQSCVAGKPLPIGASKTAPGSMSALVVSWYASAAFKGLSPASQTNYRRIVEAFLADNGDKPVAALEGRHIRGMMDAKAETPAAANRLLSILRLLMRHAVDRAWRPDDPTLYVRRIRYKSDGFATWSEADIELFEARWSLGSRARLAMALLLYTGQRRSDVIRMGRQHLRGGAIDVKQDKTGERLTIPVHPTLREAIDACPSDHLTFLMTETGKPFASGNAFYNWFIDCARKAGIAPGLSPHGLRKAAARRLAEAGCTPHQIASVTGHATLKEIERYTKAANQEEWAKVAMSRIGNRPAGP